jgi:hypothetical protein
VVGIVDQASAFVREDGRRVLEGHAMLLPIDGGLLWILLEPEGGHAHIVHTMYGRRNQRRLLCGLTFDMSGRNRVCPRNGT